EIWCFLKDILETYGFGLMFDLQDLLISVPTFQKTVLDLAVTLGLIKPLNLIPDSSLAMFYLNVLMIWQCLVVSVYATYVFRPSKTSLLDVTSVVSTEFPRSFTGPFIPQSFTLSEQ
ncbi:hypothetical protein GCK32_012801, partial [Trichostrongylus colubriformis]